MTTRVRNELSYRFFFLSILKKYRNAVLISIKMSYGKDAFLDWDDEGLDLGT